MSIKETYDEMRELLSGISHDLDKSENGNKAASQRVRTGTVKLEKLAKLFRKESISFEKKHKDQKKAAKSTLASSKKGGAHAEGKGKAAAASQKGKLPSVASKAKSASVKAKPKAKVAQAKTSFKPRPLSVKRATAKLPTKRIDAR